MLEEIVDTNRCYPSIENVKPYFNSTGHQHLAKSINVLSLYILHRYIDINVSKDRNRERKRAIENKRMLNLLSIHNTMQLASIDQFFNDNYFKNRHLQ